ncbi:MAG: hypothetical protein K2I93_02120, partial [Oscillospiraceae bacterium]|nr:hypothetical protein [Oscillospiraceae bacterium]
LCLSTSLGLLFAGGLCIVWTVQIAAELKKSRKLRNFWMDARFWGLCIILTLAVVLYLMMLPAEDIYYATQGKSLRDLLTFGVRCLLILPLEMWPGSFMDYYGDLRTTAGWIMSMIGGAACWAILLSFVLASRERWTFIVPCALFAGFFSFFYASVHHIGLGTGFLVFWLWICLEQPDGIRVPRWMQFAWAKIEEPASRKFISGAIGLMFVLPVVYSGASSYFDIRYLYGPKYIAEFIKENHLEDTKIMTQWMAVTKLPEDEEGVMYPEHYMPAPHPEVLEHYTDICGNAVSSLPYFDKNIYMNFNVTCPDDLYLHYRHAADPDAELTRWAEQGLPDFIVGYCLLDEVYSEAELDGVSYVCIYETKITHPFKLTVSDSIERIFIRKDLLDEYPQFSALY